jgi:hypothetical protein
LRFALQLPRIRGNDVAEQPAQFDRQRLRRQSENRQMPDLACFDARAHLCSKLPSEIFARYVPEFRLVVLETAPANPMSMTLRPSTG